MPVGASAARRGRSAGQLPVAVSYFGRDEDVADAESFVERSAKTDIADGGGFRGDQHGGEGAFGSGSVGDGVHFAAPPAAGAGPVHGQVAAAGFAASGTRSR